MPSSQHNILVVGGGSIGERHVRCFQTTGRAHVTLCEINSDVRTRVANEYSLSQSFEDFDKALDSNPDGVIICTPAHLHVPLAIQAAEAGIHLLIEKPLSTSLDGIDRLQSVVAEKQLRAGVAYVFRCHPAIIEIRQAIQSGQFGKPVALISVSGQHFPLYRPAYREIYYTDRATGGGAIQDGLTHMINAAEWLIGPITTVAADCDHQVLEGVEVEDTVNVIARHGSAMASYSLNQHQYPNESSTTVICERGAIKYESREQRWMTSSNPGDDWQEQSRFPMERDDLFVKQAHAFLDVMEGMTEPACSIEEALQTLRANLTILSAVESRRWESL